MGTFFAILGVAVFVGFVFLMTPRPPRHRSTAPLRRVEPPVSTRLPSAPPASVPPQFPMPPTAIQTAYAAFELGNHPPMTSMPQVFGRSVTAEGWYADAPFLDADGDETVIPSPGAEFLDQRWEWEFVPASPGKDAKWVKTRCKHSEYTPVEADGNIVSLLCTTCGERIRVEN